jgi:hypothetical protein
MVSTIHFVKMMHIISVRPLQPPITVNVESIEETKPLVVACT